ncbi:hypothetical protein WJX72_009265 [[Myrmecia] bisecta]|uniref:THUMP domain-containing protein n=1 Tax=[Myrmecia] bisecta TaxID=41462 RepID=A0AAW1QSQ3_9CHLO
MSESKRKQGHDGGGSNKRGKYFQANKSAAIPLNSRGFLITCLGGKEFQASREALSVLNEYYEKACPAKPASSSKPGGGDLSNELEAEIQQLKTEKDHLFNFHKTNVNGLIYISMKTAEGPCPVELISSMAADVKATQQCKSRLCLRFMPVQVVCYASLDDIRKASEDLVKAAFPAGDDIAPIEYAVVYEHRASVTLDRLSVINAVVDHVPKPHKVNLKEPKKTILEEFMNNCAVRTGLSGVMGMGLGVLFGILMGSMDGAGVGMDGNLATQEKQTVRQVARQMFTTARSRSWTYAKGFGAMGALFAGSECVVEKMRAKHDIWNSVYAGCATGGVLGASAGPKAACVGCVTFAAFSAFIDKIMDHD